MQVKSLAWRLTLPIIFVGVVMMAIGAAAGFYIRREYQSRQEFVSQQVAGESALVDLVFAVRDVRFNLREFLLNKNVASVNAALELETEIRRLTELAKLYANTPLGLDLLQQIRLGTDEVFAKLKEFRDQFQDTTDPFPPPALRGLDTFVRADLEAKLLTPTSQYLEYKATRVKAGIDDAERFDQLLVLSLSLLALCGTTAGVLWGLAVARGVGRSLVQLSVPIKSAAGQLNEAVGPLTVQTHWDFGDLPTVVDRMAEQIGDVIEQMRASQRRAERSEKLAAAGQLAAGMAHELRNPLTSMKLLVQSARGRSPQAATLGARDLEILEEEIERLERVVGTILDYARPPQVQLVNVDLNEVVRRSADLMSDRFRRRGIRLDLELPGDPRCVLGDASQLRQVMLNLLVNALDAGLSGHRVCVAYGDAGANEKIDGSAPEALVLEVRDEGCGLPKGMSDEIFDPFVSTKETGLGLGLSISRQIIEAHGGRIEAADRPEGGAVFRVVLPAADAPSRPSIETASAAGS